MTYLVEQSRQQHERKPEGERYEQQQAERERQNLEVGRGLARVMVSDFAIAVAYLDWEREEDEWSESKVWNPRLGADDRRDLFRYLREHEFMTVMCEPCEMPFLAPAHGSRARYRKGCRCEQCRSANATYSRARRRQQRAA